VTARRLINLSDCEAMPRTGAPFHHEQVGIGTAALAM
jgi:hypothetical protein